jgi:hypothetical protein
MSTSNPAKAMSALIPEPIVTPEGVAVRPLTLGTFALLERIKSPTLYKCEVDSLALLPSLYLMTHDPAEVHSAFDRLDALALSWAETLPPTAVGSIEAAAKSQIQRMLDVIAPEGDGKKKATTAGSPASPNGPPRPTTGIWTTFCGMFRRRPSC